MDKPFTFTSPTGLFENAELQNKPMPNHRACRAATIATNLYEAVRISCCE
jgi:hypothetical protein